MNAAENAEDQVTVERTGPMLVRDPPTSSAGESETDDDDEDDNPRTGDEIRRNAVQFGQDKRRQMQQLVDKEKRSFSVQACRVAPIGNAVGGACVQRRSRLG